MAFPDEMWKLCRETFFSMLANGSTPEIFDELEASYESLIPRLALSKFLIRVPNCVRWIIDQVMLLMGRSR